MKKILLFSFFTIILSFSLALQAQISPDTNNILYVNKNVSGGTEEGNSWANALPELADALVWAKQNEDPNWATTPLQIWIAGGTYKPLFSPVDGADFGTDQNRDNSFLLVNNVQLYGGFAGTETTLADRDLSLTANATTLSGDFNEDDIVTGSGSTLSITNNTENAYHVVISTGNVGSALLDGFSVTAANANENSFIYVNSTSVYRDYGGGMYNYNSSPSLIHVNISNNSGYIGGGMYNYNSSPSFTNVSISNNNSSVYGGGMYNKFSSPSFTNVIISNNNGSEGGGMYNDYSSPSFTNVTIIGNSDITKAGGIFQVVGRSTINNSLIFGNTSTSGTNNINGGFTASYSLIEGESDTSNGNLDATGLSLSDIFTDATNDDYSLKPCSPVINVGDNTLYTNAGGDLANDLDIGGAPRLYNSTIDIGAYELQQDPETITNIDIYVDESVASSGDGLSWSTAFKSLTEAKPYIKNSVSTNCEQATKIHIAEGSYLVSDDENDQQQSLIIKNSGLEILGSYPAGGGSRNPVLHPTILSGDLNGNNTADTGDSHTLITVIADNITLDELILENAYADANDGIAPYLGRTGGGINANKAGNLHIKNTSFRNLTAIGNGTNGVGGAIIAFDSDITLTNSLFYSNTARNGGAISIEGGASINIINTTLVNNEATNNGGAISTNGNPVTLVNSILSNNTSNNSGTEHINGSTTAITYSYLQNENPTGTSNIDGTTLTDPLFTNASNNDYTLQNSSPLIDAGDNTANTTTLDLAGNERVVNSIIDLGALENQTIQLIPDANNILYVDKNVDTSAPSYTGTGDSWDNAVVELEDAVVFGKNNEATWTATNPLKIWIAEGTYKPTATTDREISFTLFGNLNLMGGFSPTNGAVDVATRDFKTYQTVLSGDIGTLNDQTDNSYSVILTRNHIPNLIVDGVTIEKGYASIDGPTNNSETSGGGWNHYSTGSGEITSITLKNSTTQNNTSLFANGGGIISYAENSAEVYWTIENSTFRDNTAPNTVNGRAGAYISFSHSSSVSETTIVNSLFYNNQSGDRAGGALEFYENGGTSVNTITNSTFINNTSNSNEGNAIQVNDAELSIHNSILWNGGNEVNTDDSGTVAFYSSLVQGVDNTANGGLDGTDPTIVPLFTDVANEDFSLLNTSLAINAGDNTAYTTAGGDLANDLDLAGNARLVGTTIDMGAYEAQNTPPTATCQNFTAQLDANGTVTILPEDIDGGSSDAETGITLRIDIDTFNCSNIGDNNVTLTVEDESGSTDTCTAIVTVEDTIAPVANCVAPFTLQLDANGQASITVNDIENGSTDNCGVDTTSIDITDFDCSNVGDNTVTLTVTDVNGNTSTCTTTVTVEDTIAPTIICAMDTMASTDPGDCFATVTFPDALATDNCSGVTVAQTDGLPSGSQFPVGVSTVEFTATDASSNTSICTFDITVEDNEAPMAVCENITIQLDEFGSASITAAELDGGSTDACGVDSIAIDQDTFDCSNVGDNNVTLTVTDVNGNVSTCIAIVTVEDVTAPEVVCQNITVQLDATGTVSITGMDVDGGSTDACGIASYDLDMDTFDCSNVGVNAVELTVTDNNGNTASCTAMVTVEDNIAPDLVCEDFTLELGEDGTATLLPGDVIATNEDACGIDTTAVDITQFDCSDIGTPVTVQVFVSDVNGNLSTCNAVVTVVDAMAPVVTCPADQTVDPGEGNLFYEVPDYFALGEASATDNCTNPVTITSQQPAAGELVSDGIHTITLTAEDAYGNTGTCTFELTVESILGVGGTDNLGSVQLYPVPTNNQVTLGNPSQVNLKEAIIYDLTGRVIRTINLKGMGAQKTIDVTNLASATYLVRISSENGTITKQLIKE